MSVRQPMSAQRGAAALSSITAPAFGLTLYRLPGGQPLTLAVFQSADLIWVGAIVLSFILTLFLRETGVAARHVPPASAAAQQPTNA